MDRKPPAKPAGIQPRRYERPRGGSARAIAIHLQHSDGDALARAAEAGRKALSDRFAGANVQASVAATTKTE